MKISIVVPVLNSHEVVRRQILHFERIGLNDLDDVEIIFVDDGSDPPIQVPECRLHRFTLLATHDTHPWTWAIARNVGAKAAVGEHLIMVDLDHILSRALIDRCRALTEDRVGFLREFGVLDEHGVFTQDPATLVAYGLPEERSSGRGLHVGYHRNMYCMRRSLYWDLGGYREDMVYILSYPQPVEQLFHKAFDARMAAGGITQSLQRPMIYLFPNGQHCKGGDVDTNPFGLFHTLTRKTARNPWAHPRRRAKVLATK
jgi:hypothetical protein